MYGTGSSVRQDEGVLVVRRSQGLVVPRRPRKPRLEVVPVTFRQACAFIDELHRHHKRPNGHRFSVGVANRDRLVGVAMVSHPVARNLMDGRTVEVIRTCTDGTANANSMLYGACWRAARALGYLRAVTYIQEGESGVSLRAAGWRLVVVLPARTGWDCPSRPRRDRGTDGVGRELWEKT